MSPEAAWAWLAVVIGHEQMFSQQFASSRPTFSKSYDLRWGGFGRPISVKCAESKGGKQMDYILAVCGVIVVCGSIQSMSRWCSKMDKHAAESERLLQAILRELHNGGIRATIADTSVTLDKIEGHLDRIDKRLGL
jgi:hypothetical protein